MLDGTKLTMAQRKAELIKDLADTFDADVPKPDEQLGHGIGRNLDNKQYEEIVEDARKALEDKYGVVEAKKFIRWEDNSSPHGDKKDKVKKDDRLLPCLTIKYKGEDRTVAADSPDWNLCEDAFAHAQWEVDMELYDSGETSLQGLVNAVQKVVRTFALN